MLAKFLVVEESTSIAPHSTVKVKLKDAGTSNVWFIFPAVEFAARGLILANAGLLLWPAEARVYNTKDVAQNISAGDCIAINVQMENEGLKWGELQALAEEENNSSEAELESNESSEDEMVTDPNEVDGSEDEASEPEANAEQSEDTGTEASEETSEESVEEAPKKTSRSKK